MGTRRQFLGSVCATALLCGRGALAAPAGANPINLASVRLPEEDPSVYPSGAIPKSNKLVIAHWHSFRRSIDNRAYPDYYQFGYLDPHGEKDKHLAYGGWLRDRPLYRPPLSGDTATWRMHDHYAEIVMARRMGIGCFQVNSIADTDDKSTTKLMLDAAAMHGDFSIMLSIDCNSTGKLSDEAIANYFNRFGKHPNALRDDRGRLFVTCYMPETFGPERWATILARIETPVFFMPTMLDMAPADAFSKLAHGFCIWRGNDYREFKTGSSIDKFRLRCKQEGKEFGLMLSPQDHRPSGSSYWECRGSRNAVDGWRYAIDADFRYVILVSWNDYAEGHHWQPSWRTQYGFADLCRYYASWFHAGRRPGIERDVLYYFHRIEHTDAPGTGRLQTVPRFRNRIGGPPETFNEVELTAFLTEPGRISINGVVVDVAAGIQTLRVPWSPQRPQFALKRAARDILSFQSAFDMREVSDYQDLLYCSGSSSRAAVAMP